MILVFLCTIGWGEVVKDVGREWGVGKVGRRGVRMGYMVFWVVSGIRSGERRWGVVVVKELWKLLKFEEWSFGGFGWGSLGKGYVGMLWVVGWGKWVGREMLVFVGGLGICVLLMRLVELMCWEEGSGVFGCGVG